MLARRHLAAGARLVVQAGSPYFAPEAFWGIETTVRAAGLSTVPYHVDVPSFGDWGFVLAQRDGAPQLALDPPAPLRFLDADVLRAAAVFAPDRARDAYDVEPNTLNRPTLIEYSRKGWREE
jgi:spermidine synthase